MTRNHLFWKSLREITMVDDSDDVPDRLEKQAIALFQRKKKPVSLYRLKRLDPAMVRSVSLEDEQKHLFETQSGQFVELEVQAGRSGWHASGFSSQFLDGEVFLFGAEITLQTTIEQGEFEFQQVPTGMYNMALMSGGEDAWVPNLKLGEMS